jgi:hypothetical protein
VLKVLGPNRAVRQSTRTPERAAKTPLGITDNAVARQIIFQRFSDLVPAQLREEYQEQDPDRGRSRRVRDTRPAAAGKGGGCDR